MATVSGNNSNSCTLQIKNPKLPLPKYILMDSWKAGWPLWGSQVQFAQSQPLYQDQQRFSTLERTFPGAAQRVLVQTVVRCLRTSLVWRWPVLLQTQEDLLAFRAACAKLKPHLPSESAVILSPCSFHWLFPRKREHSCFTFLSQRRNLGLTSQPPGSFPLYFSSCPAFSRRLSSFAVVGWIIQVEWTVSWNKWTVFHHLST